MKIRNTTFDFEHNAYLMGILNVTPDSFSDGGSHNALDDALFHTEKMIAEGAAIIDVGGESTRPGYTPVTSDEEIERIVPVIEGIRQRFDVPISVDTFKSATWEAAIAAGADIINDIWGFKQDPRMAKITADHDKWAVLMHNREDVNYTNYMTDLIADLEASVALATEAGIAKDKLILDPGVGFAKDYEKDLIAINRLELCHTLGYPLLLGTSGKRFVGTATGGLPVDQRVEGTIATTVVGVMKGAVIFRVHDVAENYRAMKMALAIRNEGRHG